MFLTHLFLFVHPATLQGNDTAMISVPPSNTGGTISQAYPVSLKEMEFTASYFKASSSGRKSHLTKPAKAIGFYSVKKSKSGILRVFHAMLPITYLDKEVDHLAVTLSNIVAQPTFYTCSVADVTGSTIRLVTEAFANSLPAEAFPRGKAFSANTKAVKSIKAHVKVGTKHVLLVCPNSLPIPPGANQAVKGTVDDAMMEVFRTLGTLPSQWLGIMTETVEGVTAFDEVFLATVLTNKAELGDHFPAHPTTLTISTCPYVAYEANTIDRDDEDDSDDRQSAFEEIQATLRACQQRNAPQPVQQPPGTIAIPDNDSAMGPAVTSSLSNSSSERQTERMIGKLRLLCATIHEDGRLELPDLRDSIVALINGPTSSQAEALGNLLRSTGETLANSMDAVLRATRFPEAHTVTRTILVILLKGMLSTSPITDLDKVAKSNVTSFNMAHLIPQDKDTAALLNSIKRQMELRDLQQHFKEDTAKMSAVNTTTICSKILKDKYAVIGACANTTCLLHTLVDFNAESIEQNKVPLLHYAARKLAIMISSMSYDKFQENMVITSGTHPARLDYLAFNNLDRILITVAKVLQDEQAIMAASPTNGSSKVGTINTTHYAAALGALTRGLDNLIGVCADTDNLEAVAVFLNSPFNADRKTTTPVKRAANIGPSSPSPKKTKTNEPRNAGPIICTETLIPKIDDAAWPPNEPRPCFGTLRDGSRGCPWKHEPGRCNKNHGHPNTWSAAMQEMMKNHVKAHSCLMWNMNVVTPAFVGLRYTASAEERAANIAQHSNGTNVGRG